MKDSETLWAARDLIEAGWCKHSRRNIHNDVCLIEAISEITGFYSIQPVLCHLRDTLSGETDEHAFPTPINLVHFNDHADTTKQDVLDLIEKTAIRLEESGL